MSSSILRLSWAIAVDKNPKMNNEAIVKRNLVLEEIDSLIVLDSYICLLLNNVPYAQLLGYGLN